MATSNSGVKIVAAVALLAVAVFFIIRQGDSGTQPLEGQAYFYDLTSGQLFAHPIKAQPPVDAPGGADKGVKAYVYACGECAPDNLEVGYLTTITPEAHDMLARSIDDPAFDSTVIQDGHLIAQPPAEPGGEVNWVVQETPRAQQLRQAVASACAGAQPVECMPTR